MTAANLLLNLTMKITFATENHGKLDLHDVTLMSEILFAKIHLKKYQKLNKFTIKTDDEILI